MNEGEDREYTVSGMDSEIEVESWDGLLTLRLVDTRGKRPKVSPQES
jgi:hypothetical protein